MVVKDSVLDDTCIFCNSGVLTAYNHQARAEELGKSGRNLGGLSQIKVRHGETGRAGVWCHICGGEL